MKIKEIVPLLPIQQSMLYSILSKPDYNVFAEQWRYKIYGKIEVKRMEKAWNETLFHFNILQGVFRWKNLKTPVFLLLQHEDVSCKVYDLQECHESEKQEYADSIARSEFENPVNIEDMPIRMAITVFDCQHVEWVITSNHILFDGWSNSLVMSELWRYYTLQKNKKSITQQPFIQYSDYVKHILREKENSRYIEFWKDYLFGYQPCLSSSSYHTHSTEHKLEYIPLSNTFQNQLNTFCQKNNCSLAVVLYTAWAFLLFVETGNTDVVTGVTVSGRNNQKISNILEMVGLLAQNMPLRIQCLPDKTISSIMRKIQEDIINIEKNMNVDSSIWLEILPDIKNVFNEGLIIQNYPVKALTLNNDTDFKIKFYHSFYYSDMDFALSIKMFFKPYQFEISYLQNKYSAETVIKRMNRFINILQQLIELGFSIETTLAAEWIENL